MRKLAMTVSALLLAVALYYYAAPHLAVLGLREAILKGDSVELGDRVDFARVRQSIKDQLNATVLEKSSEELASNPFGALAMGLASKLVEGMVDSYVTATGLAALAKGRKPETDATAPESSASSTSLQQRVEPFANARLSRESLDRFSVWVPTDTGKETRFVFRRYGLSWKLTEVLLPFDQ